MTLYLLDTNICIALLNQRPGFESIVGHLDGLNRSQVALSAITVAELEFGIAASQRPIENRNRLERFLIDFEVVNFDRSAAHHYGPIRQALQSQGLPIDPLDFLIAAHALALALAAVLVTNNTREFNRVPGLAVEDWLLPA